MTKTSKDNAKSYYQKVKKKGTIYVWGMNYPTIITKESIEKAYRDNGTEKYNKSYYTVIRQIISSRFRQAVWS